MLVIFSMLLLPTTVSALTAEQVQAMASAVDAMLGGRKKEQLKVIDHKFNFTQDLEIIEVDASQVKALGRFTHYLRGRRDDIVTFTISFKDGVFEGFEKNVQDRGATELLELAAHISPFFTIQYLKERSIDLKAALKDFNSFLEEASDKSWQQEAEIIILNVARMMHLNALPLDPGISLIPFDCRVEGNNDGCNTTPACPQGMTIAAVVAACNLEFGSVSDGELSGVSRNTVRVVRTSDDISDGECVVGSHVIDRGVADISDIIDSRDVSVGCKEHDKNGGDCHITGTLHCQGQGQVRPVVDMQLNLPEGLRRWKVPQGGVREEAVQ